MKSGETSKSRKTADGNSADNPEENNKHFL